MWSDSISEQNADEVVTAYEEFWMEEEACNSTLCRLESILEELHGQTPNMTATRRDALYEGWLAAVDRTLTVPRPGAAPVTDNPLHH